MHKLGAYKLENIFLTHAHTVGMQWLDQRGRNLTLWMDKTGNIRNTSTVSIPASLFNTALKHYKETWAQYIKG